MQAKDIMSSKPEYLPPEDTLAKAAELIRSKNYGFIPIGENDRLIGVITDRDITIRGVAAGKDPKKTKVRELMTKGVSYCFDTDDLENVAKKMKAEQIRRIIVLNKDKRMVGIISLGDLARKSKNKQLSGEVTESVSA